MAYYEFIRRTDHVREDLSEVDNAVREYVEAEPSEDRKHPMFEVLVESGFNLLMKYGGHEVTEQMIDDIVAEKPQLAGDCGEAFLRQFLVKDYTFRAWR